MSIIEIPGHSNQWKKPMSTAVPKRLGHIWIGPKPAPDLWMKTWPERHPGWEYTIYDNDFLAGFPFRLRHLINEYYWRGLYAGVQDMMRYEILYSFGGFMADADAICRHPIDELLDKPRAYTVYDRPESDRFRGVCPILACEPGNPFVGTIIDRLAEQSPGKLRKAEVSTGNRYLMSVIRELAPSEEQLKIWPTHYFVPWQKNDPTNHYNGPDKVYAEQKWGTSFYVYNSEDGPSTLTYNQEELSSRRKELTARLVGAQRRRISPEAANDDQILRDMTETRQGIEGRLADPSLQDLFRDLNQCLETSMSNAGRPARFHGMHFYRHMQNSPLSQSPLRSRSIACRAALLSWMGQAKHALVIGFDTGHLLLSALHMFPNLRITAIEGGRWPLEKDTDPPKKSVYCPVVAKWLNDRFPGRISANFGDEHTFITDFSVDGDDPFDMVIFPSSDVASLHSSMLALRHTNSRPLAVFASPENDSGQSHADRLLLQGIAWLPVEREYYGNTRGSISVMRLDQSSIGQLTQP